MTNQERFEQFTKEYLKFDNVKNKKSNKAELHAFLLLEEIFPEKKSLIEAAEHDVIYLSIKDEDMDKISEEQIQVLQQCGISYDSEYDCLYMFV